MYVHDEEKAFRIQRHLNTKMLTDVRRSPGTTSILNNDDVVKSHRGRGSVGLGSSFALALSPADVLLRLEPEPDGGVVRPRR